MGKVMMDECEMRIGVHSMVATNVQVNFGSCGGRLSSSPEEHRCEPPPPAEPPLTPDELEGLFKELQELVDQEEAVLAPLRALRTKDGECPGRVAAKAFGGSPYGEDPWLSYRDEDRARFTKMAVEVLRSFGVDALTKRIVALERRLVDRDVQYGTLLRCKDAMGIARDAHCDLPTRIRLLRAKAATPAEL